MSSILTRKIARLLLLPILVAAVAFLVKGYASTGDGFSAGVMAALVVLLQFTACGHRHVVQTLRLRHAGRAALVGVLIAFAVVFLPAALGLPLLSHVPRPGHEPVHLGALELHSAVVYDVGVFLLIFGFGVAAMDMIASEADAREEGAAR